MMRRFLALVISLLLRSQPGISQTPASTHRVQFTTEEGSWLSFDLSRDGRWIVLDLLGQLWRLPASGGTAEPLTNAVRDSAELLDPAFSPDGRTIITHGESHGRIGVFQLPAMGGELRWIAPDALEGNLHPVHSPAWSPDGQRFLHARREGRSTVLIERELRTGAERRVEVTGVTDAFRDGLAYSADGSEIFFHTHDGGAGILPQAGRIWRAPAAGGTARPLTPPGVMARAPAPSPDGRRVAYFVVDSVNRAQVWLQSLTDTVGAPLTTDPAITATRIRWLPSGNAIMYVESGRLWRLEVRSRSRQPVPFRATVEFLRAAPDLPAVRFPAPGERVRMRGSSGVALAPDGRAIAMIALNQLWVISTETAGTAPRAIASLPITAATPAWSPDGRLIAWTAGRFRGEDLFITDTVTRTTRRATAFAGGERFPVWSPDGRQVLVGHASIDSAGRRRFRLLAVPVREAVVTSLEETLDLGPGELAQWSPRGDQLLTFGPPGDLRQRRAGLRGRDGTVLRQVQGLPADATQVWWLPGDTLVFAAASRLWRAALNVAEGVVGTATPLGDGLASGLVASPTGHLLYVGEDGYQIRRGAEPPRRLGWPLTYTVPVPAPLIVRNVRVIDGTGSAATEPRDILVERGRITSITPAGSVAALRGTEVIDARGRVAIPGLIDLHAHFVTQAMHRAALYFGVTTLRQIGFGGGEERDAIAAGVWQGPRATGGVRVHADWPFSTATELAIPDEADANHLARAMSLVPAYGLTLIKIYSMSRWATQVRLTTAAHALGARVTGHCAYPMTLLAAGIDSKEHLGWQCTLRDRSVWYDDLIQLYARSGTGIVSSVALFTVGHRLSRNPAPLPPDVQPMFGAPERDLLIYSFDYGTVTAATGNNIGYIVDAARKLHRAGALLAAGTDVQMPDAMHYELEELVAVGLSPLEAIRAGTSVGARIMGAGGDVGQIAPGYLADLILLDADPTADIRNTRRIWRVVQGGRIIDRHELVSPDRDTLGLPR